MTRTRRVAVLSMVAAAVVVLAGVFVPLPLVVAHQRALDPVDAAVTVSLSDEYVQTTGSDVQPVSGSYLAVRTKPDPNAFGALVAAAAPGQVVRPRAPVPTEPVRRPEVAAALSGLGISPLRMQGNALPVRVAVHGVDPGALGVALQVFDAASALDVARGRMVVGVGRLGADDLLECATSVDAAVDAAVTAGADAIVAPQGCGRTVSPPPDLDLIEAATFTAAVNALNDAAGQ